MCTPVQMVGHIGQAPNPGDYFTGSMAGVNYVVVRGNDGVLRAFHNVCRHKAAPIAEGSGCTQMFECMYHGWEYGGASRLTLLEDFHLSTYSLLLVLP